MTPRRRRGLIAIGVLVAAPVLGHFTVALTTGIEPPPIAPPAAGEPSETAEGLRVLGPAYARKRGKILEVRLAGTPEEIGHQHGRLLYREMVADEGELYGQFRKYVPFAPLRWLIMDISRVRFRGVDAGMSDDRRREVAAQARAFAPDPYDDLLPTYHRFVFLQSLYDISLSFEHSPLLGCTSFALTGEAAEGGHAILARNFDFEAGPVFDDGKAVFLVREQGKIPYASVAWPGLVGVVTGMNAEGLALVVHGGRAREAESEGEPVVQTMRDVLAGARTTAEAITAIEGKRPMVSHMVMILDAAGDSAVVERAPGAPVFVRRAGGDRSRLPLTNHFEGPPFAGDPANQAVLGGTSTRPRRERLDELLENLPKAASVQEVVAVLRDKKGLSGAELPLGDRRALDALIATHGVVMDATARVLWVSEGPHLTGRFLRFDLARLLAAGYEPDGGEEIAAIPEDEIVSSGAYDAWVKRGSPHQGGIQ